MLHKVKPAAFPARPASGTVCHPDGREDSPGENSRHVICAELVAYPIFLVSLRPLPGADPEPLASLLAQNRPTPFRLALFLRAGGSPFGSSFAASAAIERAAASAQFFLAATGERNE